MNCVGAVVLLALAMAYLPSVVVAVAGFVLLVSGVRRQCASSATFSNAAAQIRRNWLAQSHGAHLDAVEDGVVPVSIEPSDLGIRVETQNVAVRDVYVLALLCNPRHFGRHGPAHLGLDYHYVPLGRDQLDHFDSEVRNCIRKRAPNNIDATTDRHDALAAVRSISSERAICAESEHAINVVGIVRSEELLGGRYVIFRFPFHLCAPLDRFFWDLCGLVFKPLAERFDLLLRIRREQVLNGYVGRRNQNRFRVRESVKTGRAIVVSDTGISDPAKGHGFDKQVNVHLIDRAAAEGQACEEVIDRLLISAEEEAGKRLRMLLHLANGSIHVLVCKDWKNRPKDLVLHDRIVPSHWIDDRGIEIACVRVGTSAYDSFLLIDQARQTFGGLWADNAGVVVRSAFGVSPVELDHRLLALRNKLLCN